MKFLKIGGLWLLLTWAYIIPFGVVSVFVVGTYFNHLDHDLQGMLIVIGYCPGMYYSTRHTRRIVARWKERESDETGSGDPLTLSTDQTPPSSAPGQGVS
jgi:hypothetical protein